MHRFLAQVVLSAVALAGLLAPVHGADPDEEINAALREVKALGGFNFGPHGYCVSLPHSRDPDEVLRSLGDQHIGQLNLAFSGVSRVNLDRLPQGLRALDLSYTDIDADDMAVLAKLPNLRALDLSFTLIDDRAIENIAKIRGLQHLALFGTAITDDGLRQLQGKIFLRLIGVSLKRTKPLASNAPFYYYELRLGSGGATLDGVLQLRSSAPRPTVLVRGDSDDPLHAWYRDSQLSHEHARAIAIYAGGTFTSLGHAKTSDVRVALRFDGRATDETLRWVAYLRGLMSLDLTGSRQITDAGLAHLASVAHLESLNLTGTSVSDTGIPELGAFKELRTLALGDRVTSIGLRRLNSLAVAGGLTHLHTLYLANRAIPGSGLAELKSLRSLSVVYLPPLAGQPMLPAHVRHAVPRAMVVCGLPERDWPAVVTRGAAALSIDNAGGRLVQSGGRLVVDLHDRAIDDSHMPRILFADIEDLDLSGTKVTDAALDQISSLPKLKMLNASGTRVGGEGVARLARKGLLEQLTLARTAVSDSDAVSLQHCHNLAHLDLDRTAVGDRTLAALAKLEHVRELSLAHTEVTDAGLAHLRGYVKLRRLRLNFCDITDRGIAALKNCTELEALSLGDTAVTDGSIKVIVGLTRLRALDLSLTRVTDAGVLRLKTLDRLERLILTGTRITDSALVGLSGLTKLQHVALLATGVTPAGVERLTMALPAAAVVYNPPEALATRVPGRPTNPR